MSERGWESSEAIDEIAAAMCEALPALTDVVKSESAKVEMKGGGSYSYKYADLAEVLGQNRVKLGEHGLVLIQVASGGPKAIGVSTTLLHRSGQWISFDPLTLDAGSTPQQAGSAITYARRYSALPALGLATEDDDGARASRPSPPPAPRPLDVAAFERAATAAHATPDDVEAMVLEATGGISTNLEHVEPGQVPALRAAFKTWTERPMSDPDDPLPATVPDPALLDASDPLSPEYQPPGATQ